MSRLSTVGLLLLHHRPARRDGSAGWREMKKPPSRSKPFRWAEKWAASLGGIGLFQTPPRTDGRFLTGLGHVRPLPPLSALREIIGENQRGCQSRVLISSFSPYFRHCAHKSGQFCGHTNLLPVNHSRLFIVEWCSCPELNAGLCSLVPQ